MNKQINSTDVLDIIDRYTGSQGGLTNADFTHMKDKIDTLIHGGVSNGVKERLENRLELLIQRMVETTEPQAFDELYEEAKQAEELLREIS